MKLQVFCEVRNPRWCLCTEYHIMSLWTWWVSLTSLLYLLPSYYRHTPSVSTLTYLLSRGTFVLFIYSRYDLWA